MILTSRIYGNFLVFPAGANPHSACHAHGDDEDYPLNVDASNAGYGPRHGEWIPNDGDVGGTRLWHAN